MKLEPIADALPPGFDGLCAAARAEGHAFLDRLSIDWATGVMRFDGDGEAFLAAWMGGELVAIGGLTIDPVVPNALRMRRFFVLAAFRRSGIGRALATTLLDQARVTGRVVFLNAAPDSVPFWESLGFRPDNRDRHTHLLTPTR